MIAQLFLFITAFAFSFSPELAAYAPGSIESSIAHLVGPLVATFAIASSFPSLSFLRFPNNWIGFALAISPAAYRFESSTSLIVQSVAGLWMMAFSMMAKPLFETGGWRRVIKAPNEESDLEWA